MSDNDYPLQFCIAFAWTSVATFKAMDRQTYRQGNIQTSKQVHNLFDYSNCRTKIRIYRNQINQSTAHEIIPKGALSIDSNQTQPKFVLVLRQIQISLQSAEKLMYIQCI